MTTIISPFEKQYCSACECVVNPVGHGERCGQSSRSSVRVKQAAILGDALLAYHVKMILLATGDIAAFQMYTTNKVLSGYYSESEIASISQELVANGSSENSRATAVEAAYALSREYRLNLIAKTKLLDSSELSINFNELTIAHSFIGECTPAIYGFCYLALFPRILWQKKAKLLGSRPTVAELWCHYRDMALFVTAQKFLIEGCWHVVYDEHAPSMPPSVFLNGLPLTDTMGADSLTRLQQLTQHFTQPMLAIDYRLPGYCYLLLFPLYWRAYIAAKLGANPYVETLKKYSSYMFDTAGVYVLHNLACASYHVGVSLIKVGVQMTLFGMSDNYTIGLDLSQFDYSGSTKSVEIESTMREAIVVYVSLNGHGTCSEHVLRTILLLAQSNYAAMCDLKIASVMRKHLSGDVVNPEAFAYIMQNYFLCTTSAASLVPAQLSYIATSGNFSFVKL